MNIFMHHGNKCAAINYSSGYTGENKDSNILNFIFCIQWWKTYSALFKMDCKKKFQAIKHKSIQEFVPFISRKKILFLIVLINRTDNK